MESVFVRASCGCIVLPLGRRDPASPECEQVVLLWSCESVEDDPYGFHRSILHHDKIEKGRRLTAVEEDQLIFQIQQRALLGDVTRTQIALTQAAARRTALLQNCSPAPGEKASVEATGEGAAAGRAGALGGP